MMRGIFIVGLVVCNLAVVADGQENNGEFRKTSEANIATTLQRDTTLSDRPSTFSLAIPESDSSNSLLKWSVPPAQSGSWLATPSKVRPIPLSAELFPENFDYPGPASDRSQLESWMLQSRSNLVSPWTLQMKAQSKYKTLFMILGSVQAGATAYILYQHLKKYGFK